MSEFVKGLLSEGFAALWHWLRAVDGWTLAGVHNDWPRWALILGAFLAHTAFVLAYELAATVLAVPVKAAAKSYRAGAWLLRLFRAVWPAVGVQPLLLLAALPFLGLAFWVHAGPMAAPPAGVSRADWAAARGPLLAVLLVAAAVLLLVTVGRLNRLKFWLDRNKVFLGLKAERPRAWLFPQLRLGGAYAGNHILSFAPTGTGKGRGLILPNLLDLPDWSVFVVDPKGENALVSARWRREQGHEVAIFNPYGLFAEEFAQRGFTAFQKFNPLANLDPEDPRFFGDVDNIAEALIYSAGENENSHWTEAARGLAGFLVMYLVAEPKEPATLRRLRGIVQGGFEGLAAILPRAEESPLAAVRENVGRYKLPTPEVLSVIATAEAQLRMFRDEAVCAALDGGPFDFGRMKTRPMSVYLVLPGDYLQERARYLRLIVNAALTQLMRTSAGQHRVLALLDEFGNLGRLAMVLQGYSLLRGYGVSLWAFLQDLPQLQRLYPDNSWATFQANAGVVTVATANDSTTAKHFIERAGKAWVEKSSRTARPGQDDASETTREELLSTLEHADLLEGGKTFLAFYYGRMRARKVEKCFYDRYVYRHRADPNPMLAGAKKRR